MAQRSDRLQAYNRKRDFTRTAEPHGDVGVARSDLRFVVQKHAATRLHYDFRLEWDGVLLSWAVTKGPSSASTEKRLAVRTEDHPLSYGDFEGTIPKGEYGGGTVMLWDTGTWEPKGDVDAGLKDGKLKFSLQGERMQGNWTLVRMRTQEKRENWLLIKERDAFVQDDPDALVSKSEISVASGRNMEEIKSDAPFKIKSVKSPKRTLKRPLFVKPQLGTLVDQAPEGDEWSHETKFDGYRCLAALGKGGARFYTRSGKDWTDKFQSLADAFESLPCKSALLDGEVMAAKIEGSAFSALQAALKNGGSLVYFAFDLLSIDGSDIRKRPLSERREKLADLLTDRAATGALQLTETVIGDGGAIFAAACASKAEGIVSKRIDAPYRGTRSKSWLKVKCTRRQEFVIVGYRPSDKTGRSFASLLVASHEDGRLRYKGRIGTGFSEDDITSVSKAMSPRKTSSVEDVPSDIVREAIWVRPDLVAEVEFAEFTGDGYVRHGSFLGLRDDKSAAEVRVEVPKSKPKETIVGGIRISNADRQVFPDAGFTKGDVAHHYERVGARMIALAGHRPLSLYRCPSGIDGQCFFQKHGGGGMPDALARIEITESNGQADQYLYATRPESLIAAAQMGSIEFHVWGARTDRLERPDRLVFDLDPDEGLEWTTVRDAALQLRGRLADLSLSSGVLLTGGKGVHVWLALRRTRSWETVKLFAKTFAHVIAARDPDHFTATMSKSRRKNRIFIDWLRNERGATAISPYSLRARPGAPVAVPVSWHEFEKLDTKAVFTISDMEQRLKMNCPALAIQSDLQSLSDNVVDALQDWAEKSG